MLHWNDALLLCISLKYYFFFFVLKILFYFQTLNFECLDYGYERGRGTKLPFTSEKYLVVFVLERIVQGLLSNMLKFVHFDNSFFTKMEIFIYLGTIVLITKISLKNFSVSSGTKSSNSTA